MNEPQRAITSILHNYVIISCAVILYILARITLLDYPFTSSTRIYGAFILSYILGAAYILYQLSYLRALKKITLYIDKNGKKAISKIQISILFSLVGGALILFLRTLAYLWPISYIFWAYLSILAIIIIGNTTFCLWGYIKMYEGSNKKAKQGALILTAHSILFLLFIASQVLPHLFSITLLTVIMQWPLFGLGWSRIRASFSTTTQPQNSTL